MPQMTEQEAQALLDSCKELKAACAAAMRVIAGIDVANMHGFANDSYEQRFVDELSISGVKDGFGVRATEAIEQAEAV